MARHRRHRAPSAKGLETTPELDSVQRHRALTCDRERVEERKEIKTVGGGQGHRRGRSGGRAGADTNLAGRRRRTNRRPR